MNKIDIVVDSRVKLNVDPAEKRLKKLDEACKDFEALLVYYMLKEMWKTVHEEYDILGGYTGKEIYRAMMLDAISKEVSKRGEFGIAKMLYDSLKTKVSPGSSDKKTGGVSLEDKNRR